MLNDEFDRQAENLIAKGYPAAAGLSAGDFLKYIDPLRARVAECSTDLRRVDDGTFPFVIVVQSILVAVDDAVQFVEREKKRAISVMVAEYLSAFKPIADVEIPEDMAYLLIDVDTGKNSLNVTPDAALATILAEKRSPLTIDEGMALVTQYPEAVKKNHGFSLAGSRRGDQRVAAWWISKGAPKLGWCWAGNPHTWLGTASCGGRVGA
ncbi:MAG: DUF5701 family protein [Dehalococcoidia bacterium]